MPSPQAKALQSSSLQQELLQQMARRTTAAKTTALTQTGMPIAVTMVAANAPAARKIAKNACECTSAATRSSPAISQTTQNHMWAVYPAAVGATPPTGMT